MTPTRIAVVRMLPGVGDLLCAVPALRALRRDDPATEVTFIGLPGSRWFADRFGTYIDHWAPCSSCPGLPESTPDEPAYRRFMAAARTAAFDVAVQMHGNGRVTNAFTAALGAARWGGLGIGPMAVPGGVLVPVRPGRHEVDRCLDAIAFLGVGESDRELEFPVRPADHAAAARLVAPGGSLAVVHPGSSRPERRWPAASFAAVVDHLGGAVDRIVLTGTAGERDTVRVVASAAAASTVDLVGRTSLGTLAALMARASVVVVNDTGPAHLAAAVGTPTVTVFGASDRVRWAVRGTRHRAVAGPAGRWPSVAAAVDAIDQLVA